MVYLNLVARSLCKLKDLFDALIEEKQFLNKKKEGYFLNNQKNMSLWY